MGDTNLIGKRLVITSAYTGLPIEKTPDGIPLKGVTFGSEEELRTFVLQHWSAPVFASETKT